MRRRLTLATVAVVAAALVLSGLFTLLLVRRSARDEAQRELASQATTIAARAGEAPNFQVLARVSRALQLEGLSRVTFTARGVAGELPAGITPEDLEPATLAGGAVVSGTRGSLAFAAAPVDVPDVVGRDRRRPPPGLTAVVVTRRVDAGVARATTWFVASSAAVLALAALVADRVGRRIVRPLASAEQVTRRIAAGDLDARVEADGADPELASLARSVNAMAAALSRSRGLERQFLLSVSHDLRTPLTSIRGFAEAIADGATSDHERAAAVIAAESRRLERLVRDLLELAHLDARRFSLSSRPVDVAEVVADTAEGFRPAAAEAGIALEVEVPAPGDLVVVADPDRLAQIVANLVENALKFAAAGIRVRAAAAGSGAVLTVEDDGEGIPAGELDRVFERLYQPARPPARQLGSGLGLAIVRELAEAMGGEVRAGPAPSGGALLAVRIGRSSWSSRRSSTTT